MFTDNQSLTDFLKQSFPELAGKFLFAVILKKDVAGKKDIVLFFDRKTSKPEKNGMKLFLGRFSEIAQISLKYEGYIPLTDLIVLREIKMFQPLVYEVLLQKLKNSKVSFEEIELRRMLDKFRKSKMVVHSHSGSYTVTERALRLIPHGNSHTSSDIKRLLELGYRKW